VVVRSLLSLTALVTLAASCAGPSGGGAGYRPRPTQPGSPAGTSSPAPSTTMAPSTVPDELRFAAPRLGGGTVRGADFAGHDLVMWFWAPW
jgi:hypothetical protein